MKRTILYIDEDDDSRTVSLDAAGYRVEKARCGGDGLRLALCNRVDVVITAMRLPDMDAAELCRKLRDAGTTTVLVLGAADTNGNRWQMEALEAGAAACLTEPVDSALLLAQLTALARAFDSQGTVAQALRESEARFRVALEDSPVTVSTMDCDLRYTWVYNTRHGFAPETVVGKRPDELIPPKDAAELMALLRHVLETGLAERREVSGRTKGVRWDYYDQVEPLRDEHGQIVGLTLAQIDITERKQVEETQRDSGERLRRTLDNMLEGCAIISRDWTFVYVNDATARHAHLTRDGMIGHNMLEILPGVEKTVFFDAYRRCFEDQTPQKVEAVYTFPDGTSAWYEVRAEPSPDGIFVLSLDISDRKQAEEARARLAGIVESSEDAILSKDLSGTIQTWNAAAQRLLGYTAAEIVGKPVAVLVPTERILEEEQILERLQAGKRVDHLETVRLAKDGRRIDVSVAASPLKDAEGRVVGASKIMRDITERKHTERALEAAHASLAESDRRKDEFLAILSHELRNPLAPIRYALPVLQAEGFSEPAGRAVAVIDRQVDHLTRLVDDLLDVSRITRDKIELRREHITLDQVVKAATEAASPAIAAARHVLKISVPDDAVWLHADAARMAQVLTNLLNNSAKYTPRGGEIELNAAREEDQAVIRIRDNGIGIPPEALRTVFEMFRQVNRPDKSQGGLGIGLALVKRLVEMHGGDIQAYSAGAGQGAEFVVRLPLATDVATAQHLAKATQASGGGQRLKGPDRR